MENIKYDYYYAIYSNRKIHLYVTLLITISVLFISSICYSQSPNKSLKKCLIISDIHFNPLDDPSKINSLIKEPYEKWENILKNDSAIIDSNMRGKDTNYKLLVEAIKAMQECFKGDDKPAFIIIAGDFLWHDEKKSRSKGLCDCDIQLLKKKTIKFLGKIFRDNFKNVDFIPVFGNNDTYDNDYAIQCDDFINDFFDAWKMPIDIKAMREANGAYTMQVKGLNKLNFIALNTTVLCSGGHRFQNGFESYSQKGESMINWLKKRLADQKKEDKVWLVFHMPPGYDAYEILQNERGQRVHETSLWEANCTEEFTHIAATNNRIKYMVAGHFHRSDFRIIRNTKNIPQNYIRIVPSISPIYKNNPAFIVAEFDSNYQIVSESTHYLNLSDTSKNWIEDFKFPGNLRGKKMALNELQQFIYPNLLSINKYIDFYNVRGTKEIDIKDKNKTNINESNYLFYRTCNALTDVRSEQ